MDTFRWIETPWQDLRYAVRMLRKSPIFATIAVLVMALGVGANTAVFSVVNTVLLKPLPYFDPDRIVTLSSLWKDGGHGPVSAPDFHDWHDQNTAFSAMAYYKSDDTAATSGAAAEYANVASVTAEFFRVLGIQPVVGRLFIAEESKLGSAGAAVISYEYSQTHFGVNASALRQTVRIYDKTLSIVGVLPPRFRFPDKTDIWFPANTMFPEVDSRGGHNYRAIGRLKSNVSLEQAQAEMNLIAARLEKQYPDSNEGKSVAVARMRDDMVSNVRLTLYLLLGAVGLVLLIACANVATLLLAKATVRSREIAIRSSLGASRNRIVRQLVTEGLMLSLLAGVAALVLANWGSAALVALATADVPRVTETTIDGRVLAFTFGVSMLATLLFSLAPAFQASQIDLNEALKQAGTRSVVGRGAGRMRQVLVVAEIALSVVLLAGAGLLIKSFVALHNVALGFRPEHVLVMDSSVPASDSQGERRAAQFFRRLLDDSRSLTGVLAAGATMVVPGRVGAGGSVWGDFMPKAGIVKAPYAVYSVVMPGTFAALSIPLKRGRDFNEGDAYDAPLTAVINKALARKAYPGQDPIGRMISCGLDSDKPMRIVGIVGDVRQFGPADAPSPEIYMPYDQHTGSAGTSLKVLVRTASAPETLEQTLRRKVHDLSPEVPVKFTTMEATLSDNVAAPRFRTILLGIFAALAVCLAMAGIYGLMAYVVSQRSNEIGLRMALGASSADVLWMVLGQSAVTTGIGLVVGVTGAIAANHVLTSMLFEVTPNDPTVYAGVTALLVVMALGASYLPAWRATKVDPLTALRQE